MSVRPMSWLAVLGVCVCQVLTSACKPGPNPPGPAPRGQFPGVFQLFCDSTTHGGALPSTNGEIFAIAFQGGFNPGILIGGAFDHVNGQKTGHLARLSLDGTLDASFTPDVNGTVRAIVLDGTGIIVGGSFTTSGAIARNNLARFTLQGAIDGSFGTQNGGVTGASQTTVVNSIVIDSKKRIVIAGDFVSVNGPNFSSPGVARLNPDGTTDINFTSGKNWPDDVVNAVAVDSSNRVIIGGKFTSEAAAVTPRKFQHLARLSEAGILDTGFGEETTPQNKNGGINSDVNAVKVDTAGNVVFGGSFTQVKGAMRFGLARYTSAGKFDDQAFLSTAGVVGTVNAIEFDSFGRMLLGGVFSTTSGGNPRGSIDRVLGTGALDVNFNPEPITRIANPKNLQGTVDAILPCNSVYVGGLFDRVGPNTRTNIVKIGSTGAYFAGF
jgi:uncharacterized delta-60 repeat protein